MNPHPLIGNFLKHGDSGPCHPRTPLFCLFQNQLREYLMAQNLSANDEVMKSLYCTNRQQKAPQGTQP